VASFAGVLRAFVEGIEASGINWAAAACKLDEIAEVISLSEIRGYWF